MFTIRFSNHYEFQAVDKSDKFSRNVFLHSVLVNAALMALTHGIYMYTVFLVNAADQCIRLSPLSPW